MKSKVLFFLTVFAFATTSIFAQKWSDAAIDSLIAKMSIEEKVGQMTQIDLGVIAEGGICNLKQPQRIDIAKLQEAIGKYKIGSIQGMETFSSNYTSDQEWAYPDLEHTYALMESKVK